MEICLPNPVLTKRQNYSLWQGGAFGNKLRAWRTVEEWRDSGFAGRVVLRMVEGGKGPCRYNLLPDEVESVVHDWITMGITSDQIMVNEAAPDHDVILQGEYLNDIYALDGKVGWGYFRYSRHRSQMRDALAAASEVSHGLRSDLLLKLAMTPSSYDDWNGLIERYPGHVLEVSIYDRCLGDIPGRNSLVWEVRRY
jgi:hypothetical protein